MHPVRSCLEGRKGGGGAHDESGFADIICQMEASQVEIKYHFGMVAQSVVPAKMAPYEFTA